MTTVTQKRQGPVELRRWEFVSIVIGGVLFIGIVIGGVVGLGAAGALGVHLPSWLWFAAGTAALGVALLPIESVVVRTYKGREISIARSVFWTLAGVVVGTVLFVLFS